MAEPIIIIKENPGTLMIEVLDQNGDHVPGSPLRCPSIPYNASSELDVEGSLKSKVKPKKDGNIAVVKIQISAPAAG